jgi:hypothetical protein
MGKGNSSAPAAPDPLKTAQTESQFNRLNTYSPDGSGVRFGYTGADGQFTTGTPPEGAQAAQSFVEAPWQKAIRESMQRGAPQLTDRIITDNVTNMPGAPVPRDRSDVAGDIFNRNFSLIQPAMEKSQTRLLTNLQARGIPVGAEAFNDAYGDQVTRTQETIARMGMDANIQAGNEQTREFNIDTASRNRAMSELMALMGGSYAPQGPLPSGQAQAVDYSGNVANSYAAEMNQHSQAQANRASIGGTIGSLGAAAIMKCSASYKAIEGALNESWAAEIVGRLPLHIWSYNDAQRPDGDHGGKHVGPMAEDFHRLTTLGDGKSIDVVDAVGLLFGALQWAVRAIELQHQHIAALDRDLAQMKTSKVVLTGGRGKH